MTPTNLRALRKSLGLTQAQLAERLGVPANTISRWELGNMPIQHPALLRLAIEHLRCIRYSGRRKKVD